MTHAPTVIVLMGVAGCGKSTAGEGLSRALGWPFRDADSFHPPANVEKMRRGTPLDDADRAPWLAAIAAWIDERCEMGAPGIVSCSALKRAYRDHIVGPRSGVRLVYLTADPEVIRSRLAARKGHFMPASLLDSQLAVLEEPGGDERPVVVDVALPPKRVVATILARLGLAPAGRQA